MKKSLLIITMCCCGLLAVSQTVPSITVTVKDATSFDPLPGASITIDNKNFVLTDNEGMYSFPELPIGQKLLSISYAGYRTVIENVKVVAGQTSVVNVLLSPNAGIGNHIVISASKRAEKITHAPASIYLIDEKKLAEFPGSNVGELVATIQGVEFTRSGVDQITFNARGFHSAFNNKVMQLVDGRISMAALSGSLPLFNNGSINKEDIERIEIILGPQSALYGPNAHNAVFNYITKDPRKYGGTTVSTTVGNQSQSSMRLRHAAKVDDKWAYKFSGEYSSGREFKFYDSVYAGGFVYGPPVAIPERNVDFNYSHLRGEGALYYNLNKEAYFIVSGGASSNDFLQVTTAARNQMKDVTYSFVQARLVHPRFYATAYQTWGNIGSSYVIANYTRDFWDRTHSTLPRTDSIRGKLTEIEAEGFAKRLGNRFKEKGQRFNTDIQYNNYFARPKLFVVAGASYQKDNPNGYGVNLVDVDRNIEVTQYGTVLQVEKKLPYSVRLSAATRYDYHSVFGHFLAPKFALLKDLSNGSFRISYGKAYAMPSILSQFAKIGNFLFGNGSGITYIPVGTKMGTEQTGRKTTNPLMPEEVYSWELGYKAAFRKLFIDVSTYRSLSKNFLSPPQIVAGRALTVGSIPVIHNPAFAGTVVNDTLKNAFFTTFFNYGNVIAFGVDAGLGYQFNDHISIALKYSWFGSDITKQRIQNDANKDNFVSAEETSLNAPRNRGNASIRFSNLLKGKMMFSATARYIEQYDFYSGNQIGTASGKGRRGFIDRGVQLPPIPKNFNWGALGGFTSVDLQGSYQFKQNLQVNLGITNLFNTNQVEFVASPSIGRLISLELKIHVPDKPVR